MRTFGITQTVLKLIVPRLHFSIYVEKPYSMITMRELIFIILHMYIVLKQLAE